MTAIKKAELLAGCVCAGLARRSLFSFPVLIDYGAEKKNLDLGEGESTRSRVCVLHAESSPCTTIYPSPHLPDSTFHDATASPEDRII